MLRVLHVDLQDPGREAGPLCISRSHKPLWAPRLPIRPILRTHATRIPVAVPVFSAGGRASSLPCSAFWLQSTCACRTITEPQVTKSKLAGTATGTGRGSNSRKHGVRTRRR